MTNILAIETFDTSVLADAILGEDNELIFLTDEDEVRQAEHSESPRRAAAPERTTVWF